MSAPIFDQEARLELGRIRNNCGDPMADAALVGSITLGLLEGSIDRFALASQLVFPGEEAEHVGDAFECQLGHLPVTKNNPHERVFLDTIMVTEHGIGDQGKKQTTLVLPTSVPSDTSQAFFSVDWHAVPNVISYPLGEHRQSERELFVPALQKAAGWLLSITSETIDQARKR